MSADQHRAVAQREQRQAQRDVSGTNADSPGRDSVNAGLEPELLINPDAASSNAANERLEHAHYLNEQAREHEQAAAQLERQEDAQCKAVPSDQRPTCPVVGPVSGVLDVAGGVRVLLAPEGGSAHRVLALMRCHYAYARVHGWGTSQGCALDIPGIEFRDTDDPHAIDIVGTNPHATDEIRKRAHGGELGS